MIDFWCVRVVVSQLLRIRFCLLFGGMALGLLPSAFCWAQADSTDRNAGAIRGENLVLRSDLEQRFLRVEGAFWGTYGLRLSKNGQTVGPSLFSVVPDRALQGSEEARRHASHARAWQGFAIGLGAAAIGLLAGSVAVRANENEWTNTAKYLGGGGIASVILGYVCAVGRTNEMMEAVNSYNYDLVKGSTGN